MLTSWRTTDRALAALGAEMDRMMNGLATGQAGWTGYLAPAADVIETEAAYRVVLDLPGLDPASIRLQVEKDVLSVQADRKQPAPAAGETVHRSERAFGTFSRSFALPRGVDAEKVEARYEQGVLTVELPKRSEVRARTISVQVK